MFRLRVDDDNYLEFHNTIRHIPHIMMINGMQGMLTGRRMEIRYPEHTRALISRLYPFVVDEDRPLFDYVARRIA